MRAIATMHSTFIEHKGAMMSEIRVTVQGNAGEEPRLWADTGRPFARVDVASTPRIRVDEDWIDGDTQWIRVKAWGRLAENLAASVRKGDALIVTGTLRYDEYTNADGITHKRPVVHANGIGFDLVRTRAQAVKLRSPEVSQEEPQSAWPDVAAVGAAESVSVGDDEAASAPF